MSYFIGNSSGNAPGGSAGGDLNGTYPNPGVINIHGASVPASGSLTTGNGLYVTGVSTLSYSALNLAGGANYVTGALPTANQVVQTMGGDVTGTTAANTVISLTGGSGVVNISSAGNIITWNNATTAPGIKQADNTTNSATAANLTIQSQNATGTTTIGGDLVLKSGSGTTTNGSVKLNIVGTTYLSINTFGSTIIGAQGTGNATAYIDVNQSNTQIAIGAATGTTSNPGIGFGGTYGSNYAMGILPAISGTTSLIFGSGVTSAVIKQVDNVTNSATAANLTVQAQNATGTTTIGGNLVLTSGTGTSTNGLLQLQSAGTTVGQFNQTNTDFVAIGGSNPAQSGAIRLHHNGITAVLVSRNNAGSGDDIIMQIAGNSNGEEVSLQGTQYANLGVLNPAAAGTTYIMAYQLQGQCMYGASTHIWTRQGYSTASNGFISFASTGATDNGAVTLGFGENSTSALIKTIALASTSGGSGAAGTNVTVNPQAGQAATGASNNGGKGGNLIVGGGLGGTSGAATAGIGGVFSVVGGVQYSTITITTTYTVDTNSTTSDHTILCNQSSGFTLTLPTPTAGRVLVITDIAGNANTQNITISQHSAEKINGANTYVLNLARASVVLQSDGTNWFIIASYNGTVI